ncbi:osomolarity two-component system, phosphorelay intermediate protein YPD1 [Fusarium oxysporum f. sp. melonis 26406]|uniref:Osomolarity two-component system, phosphorelay intermediate protein YPD1 n=1 Tax=Fusarium oxysporum f. sp. melonis 26406 TaxID=1089452 RepID=W9Z2U3_FUSOX|nr:osomolarity two-component system, phosphorelay intermediate protein YPD1 [Fusarium oxysporum f. sp. melonis 26406]
MSGDQDHSSISPDAQDFVDMNIFEQILELDDEGPDREFSKELVFGFFEQAENTFDEIGHSLEERNLEKLLALGHFLKGSAAALGIYKVRDACEKIQHLAAGRDESGFEHIEREESLTKIRDILPTLKIDYKAAKDWLTTFFRPGEYGNSGSYGQ